MADQEARSAATPSVAERVQNARLRALSAISHFAATGGEIEEAQTRHAS